MADDGVRLVKPGKKFEGAQGVTYDAGVSRNTAGAEKVCMNVLPMPPGAKAKPHYHKGIETIAYMLKGECTVFHGEKLESQTLVKQGEQFTFQMMCLMHPVTLAWKNAFGSSFILLVMTKTILFAQRT